MNGLRLDPAVRQDYAADGSRVAIALAVGDDCLLALVEPGRTQVFTPPRVNQQPREVGCGAPGVLFGSYRDPH